MENAINLTHVLQSFDDEWMPRNIATVNDYEVRVAHIRGEFVWHSHEDTDEFFQCIAGEMQIELRDRTISMSRGDIYVVPKGVEHKPSSANGADILMFEVGGTTNTGTTNEVLPDYIETTSGVQL